MRFLFGLIIGAMVTIVVATMINAPTPVVFEDIRGIWGELADKVRQNQGSASGAAGVRVEAKDEPVEPSAPASPSPGPPVQPLEFQNIVTQQDTGSPDVLSPEPEDTPLEYESPEFANVLPPETATAMEAVEIPAITRNVHTKSSAAIWEPFHSEVSATGFAKRLSLQLGYPFQVTKDGPARYLVVFDYKSDEQRAVLVQQIATLTGYRAR